MSVSHREQSASHFLSVNGNVRISDNSSQLRINEYVTLCICDFLALVWHPRNRHTVISNGIHFLVIHIRDLVSRHHVAQAFLKESPSGL